MHLRGFTPKKWIVTDKILGACFLVLVCWCIAGIPLYGDTTPGVDSNNKTGQNPVYVIPIQGGIDRTMVIFIRRSVEQALKEGAGVLIFSIDTFGGRVDSALQITTIIGSITSGETVAYVTASPESAGVSWSAGALISFSCSSIYMAPGTSMGAAAPVYMSSQGTQTAPEKVVSALRAQIAALAEKNGYPPDIARAMVDMDIELREVYVEGKLMAVSSEEVERIKQQARAQSKTFGMGKVISPRGKLLALTAGEMQKYGVSSGTVANVEKLLEAHGVGGPQVAELGKSIADRAVGFITSSGFTALLIIIGLVALLVEITSPGFGYPGTIALICFAVVFASYGLLGTVGSAELILFLAGLVLLIVEIFIIPGFGVAGIAGILAIVTSLVLSMQGFIIPEFEWERDVLKRNVTVVVTSLVSALVIFGIMAYFLPRLRLFSRLALSASQTAEQGYTVQTSAEKQGWIGKRGIAVTTLRPSGKARFGDEVMYVETEGEYVEAGRSVEVIETSGNRIVVRKC
ncbi:MAG: NfeD family protein [Spirochaetota bacterium]